MKKDTTKKVQTKGVNPWVGKERDAHGFITGTKTSMIVDLLGTNAHTKVQILNKLDKKYPGANNKTTLNVLIGDIQKPVGTYHSSRGLKIKASKKGVLSIS